MTENLYSAKTFLFLSIKMFFTLSKMVLLKNCLLKGSLRTQNGSSNRIEK